MTELEALLIEAESRRTELVQGLTSENTDCWRLFHGVAEGKPGLTIDKYGDLTLAQTFRDPLSAEVVQFLQERYGECFVYNHRGQKSERFDFHEPESAAIEKLHIATEIGLKYGILARHRGLDPHLFLDLRVG